MADIASTDVTLTVESGTTVIQRKERRAVVKIAFGDGALTYPSGGVPLPTTPTSWGMKRNVQYIRLVDENDGSGIVWKYDFANHKLRGWHAPAQTHAHDLKIIASITPDENIGIETTAGPILGSTTGFTVAKADSATKGGVLSETLGVAALTEISGAVAAQTLYAEAIGA